MKILFVNLPFSGHTNPTLPLAAGLARRGHDVTYINAEEFRAKIEKTGARFVPYANYPEKPGENDKKKRSFRAAYDTAMSLGEKFDLLIYEMFFYPGIRIAENMGIPCVRQFSQPAWSEETWKTAPPVFRLSAGLIDVQVMGRKNKKHMGIGHRSMTEAIIGDSPDLNIVYVPEVFQKCRESFDESYMFTVPESESIKTDAVIPYDNMEPPIVYISLGSIISNKGFCKECVRAFGGKNMSVILNTGKVDPGSLGCIPGNIYAYSFVPQTEVLSRADVFLTHCGMNSVNEAMRAGVPMVAMPFLNDQLENAAQLVRMGLARRVRPFPSRGRELYSAVLEVYNDKEYRRRSEDIMWKLEEENNFEEILDRVEGLC